MAASQWTTFYMKTIWSWTLPSLPYLFSLSPKIGIWRKNQWQGWLTLFWAISSHFFLLSFSFLQLTVHLFIIKLCQCLDSNCRPLVLEATPEPQPLPETQSSFPSIELENLITKIFWMSCIQYLGTNVAPHFWQSKVVASSNTRRPSHQHLLLLSIYFYNIQEHWKIEIKIGWSS